MEEVRKLVSKAKKNKAPGIDGLVNDVLKNDVAIRAIHTLFNRCLTEGKVPIAWKLGIISPITKGGSSDPREPLSYRGISLLPVISKLFTAGLSQRLSKYLEQNHLLVNEQNGFRPRRSCLDHIFSLHNICQIRLNHNQDAFLTIIDFSKAFDYVQREYMLHKLMNLGIKGNIYSAIKSLYTNPISAVMLNGELGDWIPVAAGVRQGDSPSPLLFACFINDLGRDVNA